MPTSFNTQLWLMLPSWVISTPAPKLARFLCMIGSRMPFASKNRYKSSGASLDVCGCFGDSHNLWQAPSVAW
jgi:hypothetical protein